MSTALAIDVSTQPLLSFPCPSISFASFLMVQSVSSRSAVKIWKKMGRSLCSGELYLLLASHQALLAQQSSQRPVTELSIFSRLSGETAVGDSVRNTTKVKFCRIHCSCHLYSQLFLQAGSSIWRELWRGYLVWSSWELRWGWLFPAACSLPFLKMEIMLSFTQSSTGAFYSHSFP